MHFTSKGYCAYRIFALCLVFTVQMIKVIKGFLCREFYVTTPYCTELQPATEIYLSYKKWPCC